MKDKFAEIAVKETYRAKSIKGNVYNWNTVIGDGRRIILYFLYKKRRTLYIAF
jgi:D, D-carboxypeptidase, putative